MVVGIGSGIGNGSGGSDGDGSFGRMVSSKGTRKKRSESEMVTYERT